VLVLVLVVLLQLLMGMMLVVWGTWIGVTRSPQVRVSMMLSRIVVLVVMRVVVGTCPVVSTHAMRCREVAVVPGISGTSSGVYRLLYLQGLPRYEGVLGRRR
jgi:hypothetical protein